MRLFVGIWPPPDIVAVLAGLPRPEHPGVRWTTEDQWHVTLRFLGEVADDDVPLLLDALRGAGTEAAPRVASLGPATTRLGATNLVVPVAGVDDLAEAVRTATTPFGAPPEARPFAGHLTVARGRGGRRIPTVLAGQAVSASWTVEEVALVRSHLGQSARYETLASVRLDGRPLRMGPT